MERLRLLRQGYVLTDDKGREVLRFHERLEPGVVRELQTVVMQALWYTKIDPWGNECETDSSGTGSTL